MLNIVLNFIHFADWTYLIFCFIASATFLRWVRMFWRTFANDFRQLIRIGVPWLWFLIDHCWNGNTSWTGWRCNPHKLNFTLHMLIGLFQHIDTIDVKFGHWIVEQLKTSHTSWIHCRVSAFTSVRIRYGASVNSEIRKLLGVFSVCTRCHQKYCWSKEEMISFSFSKRLKIEMKYHCRFCPVDILLVRHRWTHDSHRHRSFVDSFWLAPNAGNDQFQRCHLWSHTKRPQTMQSEKCSTFSFGCSKSNSKSNCLPLQRTYANKLNDSTICAVFQTGLTHD